MAKKRYTKHEQIVEAVRRGLEGEAAIAFLHEGGYALNSQGIARQLRMLGGRGRVRALIEEGGTNEDIVAACLHEPKDSALRLLAPEQGSLFAPGDAPYDGPVGKDEPLFPTTHLSIRIPSDLYTALRLAAHAEKKSLNQVIVDTLTWAMSRLPRSVQGEFED